jgi:hypothetical protein
MDSRPIGLGRFDETRNGHLQAAHTSKHSFRRIFVANFVEMAGFQAVVAVVCFCSTEWLRLVRYAFGKSTPSWSDQRPHQNPRRLLEVARLCWRLGTDDLHPGMLRR